MRREHEVFGDARFERPARLSNGHPYNLRKSRTYRRKRTAWTRPKPSAVAIGERRPRKPNELDRPNRSRNHPPFTTATSQPIHHGRRSVQAHFGIGIDSSCTFGLLDSTHYP